ncbi:putative serine/threonine-protein kinase [Sesbania bispinosa]|nr:putative serine/threonine-protein kinase [Sesbania bispinosa]
MGKSVLEVRISELPRSSCGISAGWPSGISGWSGAKMMGWFLILLGHFRV